MKKNLTSTFILIAYCAILIKVMVFKDIPTIRIGSLMLNFAGTNAGQAPNFVPFKTIVPYLLGFKGWIIAGVNLAGNIALLVPLGLLAPSIYRRMTWKASLALGVAAGLCIEVMQTVLHVGIFDIDDVILNALGVMIGYAAFTLLARWIRARDYKKVTIAAVTAVAAAAALYGGVVYPMTHQAVNPRREGGDLCGGTGGTGQIVSMGNHTMTIKRQNDGFEVLLDSAFSGRCPDRYPPGYAKIAPVAQLDEARQHLGIDLVKATQIETATADRMRTQLRKQSGIRLETTHQVED